MRLMLRYLQLRTAAPTGTQLPAVCFGSTISNLAVTGVTNSIIKWYDACNRRLIY